MLSFAKCRSPLIQISADYNYRFFIGVWNIFQRNHTENFPEIANDCILAGGDVGVAARPRLADERYRNGIQNMSDRQSSRWLTELRNVGIYTAMSEADPENC
jgi:hypothetical protein